MATQVPSTIEHLTQPRRGRGGHNKRHLGQDLFGFIQKCSTCKKTKPVEFFYRAGCRSSTGWSYKCKKCESESGKRRIEQMTPEHRAKRYASNRKYAMHSIRAKANMLRNGIMKRSKRFGYDNDVTIEYVVDKLTKGRCEATGIRFQYKNEYDGVSGATPFSPSPDRIDNSKGYTVNNIQIVCSMYNIGKGAHDETDFIAMCMIVAERNKENTAAIARAEELLE